MLIISLIIYSLNLHWIVGYQTIKKPTFNIGILFDVSLSMTAKDIQPSRWEVARDTLVRLIDSLKWFNIFIVSYSGRAFVWSPITDNLKALKIKLQMMQFKDFPPNPSFLGTAIGNAILLGIDNILRFVDEDVYPPGALILITDGDSNTGVDPIQAAQMAKQAGIKIYAIWIGAETLPIWKTAIWEEEIVGVNKELLQQIAQITSGDFVVATSKQQLETFFDQLSQLLNQYSYYKEIKIPQQFFLNQYLGWLILFLASILLLRDLAVFYRLRSIKSL